MKHKYKVDHHIGYRDFYDIFGYIDANRPEFIHQACYLLRNVRFSYLLECALDASDERRSYSYELEELSSMAEIADMFQ